MSGKHKKHRSTLADALDAMEWDYKPGEDPKLLLRPVGMVFQRTSVGSPTAVSRTGSDC